MSKLDSVRAGLDDVRQQTRSIINTNIDFPGNFPLTGLANDVLEQTKSIAQRLEGLETDLAQTLDKISNNPSNASNPQPSAALDSIQHSITQLRALLNPLDLIQQELQELAISGSDIDDRDRPRLQRVLQNARSTLENVKASTEQALSGVVQRFDNALNRVRNADLSTFLNATSPLLDEARQGLANIVSITTGVADTVTNIRTIVGRIARLDIAKTVSQIKPYILITVVSSIVIIVIVLALLITTVTLVALHSNKKT